MVENGEIGIFSLNREAYIKKLQEDKNGVFLISLNEKYPPIPVKEHNRFDILGTLCQPSKQFHYTSFVSEYDLYEYPIP